MSSILKALRKLEEDKVAMGEERVDIARDILKRSAQRPKARNLWPPVFLILLMCVIGTLIYFFLDQDGFSELRTESIEIRGAKQADISTINVVKKRSPDLVAAQKTSEKSGSAALDTPVDKKTEEPLVLRSDGSPFIQLSGIAYRQNPQERIAIVNDLPVMQGTMIEGVKVVKILPRQVVFEWKDQTFTLEIDKN